MRTSVRNLRRAIVALAAALVLSTVTLKAQFPSFPPSGVTITQDRDQMMWQLGLSFPPLPGKTRDANAPPNTWPSSASSPDGNWTDSAGHTITRSGHGLWNNYDDTSAGLFPGAQSWRVGSYSKIDLLKMNNGSSITTSAQWWNQRRPEVLKDAQEQIWGVIPPDSILPKVTWSTTTTTGGSGSSAYRQKVITGIVDIISNTSWGLSTSQAWLTLSSVAGYNSRRIILTATNNVNVTQRMVVVTISSPGRSSDSITVTQAGSNPSSIEKKERGMGAEDFQLSQNYPNPFNPSTVIKFYLPRTQHVTISLYTIAGQELENLVDTEVPAGQHEVYWIANNQASGVYIYRIQAGAFVEAKKLIYQK